MAHLQVIQWEATRALRACSQVHQAKHTFPTRDASNSKSHQHRQVQVENIHYIECHKYRIKCKLEDTPIYSIYTVQEWLPCINYVQFFIIRMPEQVKLKPSLQAATQCIHIYLHLLLHIISDMMHRSNSYYWCHVFPQKKNARTAEDS